MAFKLVPFFVVCVKLTKPSPGNTLAHQACIYLQQLVMKPLKSTENIFGVICTILISRVCL